MAAGGSDLERTLRALLSLDVRKVDRGILAFVNFRVWPSKNLSALEMIGDLNQRLRGDDLDLRTGPRRLGSAGTGADQSLTAPVCADCRRQHTRDRSDRAIQRKLPQHCESAQRVTRNSADRPHQTERDGKVIVATLLRQIRRSEIDGDTTRRQCQTGCDQCSADALLGLGHSLVRKSDNIEGRQPGCNLHLHVDGARLDALECNGRDSLDHATSYFLILVKVVSEAM